MVVVAPTGTRRLNSVYRVKPMNRRHTERLPRPEAWSMGEGRPICGFDVTDSLLYRHHPSRLDSTRIADST